jgi:histidinol-phosphate aminotransferase
LTPDAAAARIDALMPYERDNIRGLSPYVPGEQPQTDKVVKLNTNENPYPPARAVMDAIASVTADSLRRYPPPLATPFRLAAAEAHDLNPDQVIATNGGDELLRLAITVFCDPTGSEEAQGTVRTGGGAGGVGETWPTYSLYDVLARIHDTPILRVPLDEDWAIPQDFAGRLNEAGCRLALVVNPHAPTGRFESSDRLRQIATDFNGVLLVDEAYVGFARHDASELVRGDEGLDNVLLLRTLSKGYSLAGLRFGYGLGHRNLIAALDKARDSYNTDILAQVAAVAALASRKEAAASCEKVVAERRRLGDELARLGWWVWPSDCNFILAKPPEKGPNAQTIYESLKRDGVFVRYFDQDRLRDKLRITIGTPDQNDTLLRSLTARG